MDMAMTSPPFLALRSYLPDEHPLKHMEIGSEPSPAEFLDTLLALTAELERVLTPTGSICVELGDTYSGSGGAGGDYADGGNRDGQNRFNGTAARARAHAQEARTRTPGPEWPLAKSLCGIPHLYHLSLAYGRNLLTGEESPAGRWLVRNVVAWCRPNPPVGALADKFRPATSYITIATKAPDRWFDLDAVRHHNPRVDEVPMTSGREAARAAVGLSSDDSVGQPAPQNPAGAPPLDWWEIPTEPYSGSHYATWPRRLLTRPIESMCPHEVCRTCGEPRRRIVGEAEYVRTDTETVPARLAMTNGDRVADGVNQHVQHDGANTSVFRRAPTLGWTDCGHDNYRRGVVLDPFAGSGTTLAVATGLGRDAVGIDLDSRNADLAVERVGMFLTVVDTTEPAA